MPPVRLGTVRFLNTLPLVDGLDALADLELVPEVPSRLIETLASGRVDVALCSSIDAQRPRDVVVIPAGLLGADGESLTVRLFSRVDPARIRRVHCDTDSHTSVALLRILLAERSGVIPELVPHASGEHGLEDAETVLLIGDKVVTAAPAGDDFPHQIDLGAAWTELTGLPFIFALWIAPATTPEPVLRRAFIVLDRQRRANALRIASIVSRHARAYGWPEPLARRYLERHITFAPTRRRFEGLRMFYAMAHRHGVLDRVRPLAFRPGFESVESETTAPNAVVVPGSTGTIAAPHAQPATAV